MTYLLNRNGNFYYNREVPVIYRDLDPRKKIRVALNTASKREAWRKAVLFNDQVEAYWANLVSTEQKHDETRFGKIVHISRQMGFTYLPMPAVVNLPLAEVTDRVIAVKNATPGQVEAVLGVKEEPSFCISDALEKYWELTRHKIIDKTANQIRKWKNPRIKAIKNLTTLAGDKNVKEVTKTDLLALRDWWIDRIESEELTAKSANKDFIHLKEILTTVSRHFKLKLKTSYLFHDLLLEEDTGQTRLPFTSEQIIGLFQNQKFLEMDEDVRLLLMAMSETGARNTEIIGLLPEHIKLNDPIPHISIASRKGHKLKNKYSRRMIPLVGYSLDAFVARPNGFPHFQRNPDELTNKANKYLRANDLFPSEKHSAYSLRHSFQDRLTSVNAGERVQADLMGHKFSRVKYGDGASLKDKKEWMDKICLKCFSINHLAETILPSLCP